MTKRPQTKDEWIAAYKRLGWSVDRAAEAAAIAVGESDGDVIEVDGTDDEEGRVTRTFKTNWEHVAHARNIAAEKKNRST